MLVRIVNSTLVIRFAKLIVTSAYAQRQAVNITPTSISFDDGSVATRKRKAVL